jgi:hypothetical protein
VPCPAWVGKGGQRLPGRRTGPAARRCRRQAAAASQQPASPPSQPASPPQPVAGPGASEEEPGHGCGCVRQIGQSPAVLARDGLLCRCDRWLCSPPALPRTSCSRPPSAACWTCCAASRSRWRWSTEPEPPTSAACCAAVRVSRTHFLFVTAPRGMDTRSGSARAATLRCLGAPVSAPMLRAVNRLR